MNNFNTLHSWGQEKKLVFQNSLGSIYCLQFGLALISKLYELTDA